jgi:PKD repeat protein
MRKLSLLSTLVLFFNGITLHAQDFSNKGKEFYLCFPNHVPNGNNLATLSIYITSDKASTGTITMANGAFSGTFNIAAYGIQEIQIPWNVNIHISNPESNTIIQKSIKIKTDPGKPAVVAYAQQWAGARSCATLLLPTNVLGKKYRAISFTQNGTNQGTYLGRSQFQIIAVKPNTDVRITPFKNGVAGATITINFPNAGDMYQYQSTDATASTQDLTGTYIESIPSATGGCNPIAVFSGSSATTLGYTNPPGPNCNGGSYDPLWQQCYPISTWGKNFGFVPFSDYPLGVPYRVMASEDNTNVYINGALVANINAGKIYPTTFNSNPPIILTPASITADKPICVTEYAYAQNCTNNGLSVGDPDMVILNPIEQNIQDITVFSSTKQAITRQWVNVLLQTIAVPSFRISKNGGPLLPPVAAWQTFTNLPGYSYLRESLIGISSARMLSDSGFNAIAYGFGNVESYGYSAGTNVKDLYQQIKIQTEFGIDPEPTVCTGAPFRFKVSLPYCADSIRWDLSNMPGPPAQPPTIVYTTCVPGAGGPDSTTVVNGKTIYWYSLPLLYTVNTTGIFTINMTVYSPNSDGCGSEQEISFDLNVYDPPVGNFTWTTNGCSTQPVQFTETTSQVPKPTYRFWWDFGDPASGPANNSTLRNPTHTFTGPGTYTVRYTAITTPGCLSDTINHQITLNDPPQANFTVSAPLCPNMPVSFTDISNPGPGATIQQWTWDFGDGSPQVVVIAPNPPNQVHTYLLPGTYNATLLVETATGCPSTLFTLPVIILPDGTITLTSAPGTDNQTVCINTPITNITYAVAGSSNGGSVSGLPAGVTGNFAGGVITISGTPTVSGTFNYTVTTTGPCVNPMATGIITVTPDGTITLTSAPGTDNQTVCINTPITNITYAVGASGTGGSVSGLPAGVTGSFAGGVITISGTPTVSGVFNYTVNTTGPCVNPNATGTITVTPDGTITLTSAPGTNNQTVCINTPITNITYAVGASGTGGSVSGLPSGVTGSFAAGVITISGTPTVSGTFNYLVTTTGPCVNPTATGTITVTQDGTITLTSAPGTDNQAVCLNSPITPITYAVAGSGTGGSVTGLPAGVTGTFAGGVITITGNPSVSGTFNYTVNTTGPCVTPTATGTILVRPLPTAMFTVTPPNCETRTICFTDISTPNAGSLTGWDWDFGDGSPHSTIQNPCHTYTTAGTYNVILVVTTNFGCVSINPAQQVIINARPLAGYIVPEVCLSDTYAQFTDTSKVATPDLIVAWDWNFGDPGSGPLNTSTLQNPTHSYSATGSYNVRLIATSNRGCKDTIVQVLFVNGSFPVADFTVQNPANLCANDSVAIAEASTVFPGTITKVEIYWDNVGQPGVFDTDNFPVTGKIYKHLYPNFQAPLTKNFTIRYRAYSGGVCVNDKLRTITVNAAPKVVFNPMPNICYDAAPYQIPPAIARETGGVPGNGGVFTGPGVSPTGLFSPAVAGVGTHRILFTFTSTAGGCVDTASNLITVWDTASAKIDVQPLACEKNSISFTSTNSTIPAGNGSITGWTWNFGDPASGPLNTSNAQNPSHLFTGWGNYNVTLFVTTSNGCKSPVRTLQVHVNPEPKRISTHLPVPVYPMPAFHLIAALLPLQMARRHHLHIYGILAIREADHLIHQHWRIHRMFIPAPGLLM